MSDALPDPMPSALAEEDVVTPTLAKRLHVTLGHPWRRFAPGDAAPAGVHWCLAPEGGDNADLGPDGLARHGIIPEPPGLPRRMWAGVRIVALRPFRIGEVVSRRSRRAALQPKQGRSGPLAFAELVHEFLVDGEAVLTETQSIVCRPAERSAGPCAPAAGEPPNPGPKPRSDPAAPGEEAGGTVLRELVIDPLVLFRYSALTFNAHRIHFDRAYAQTEEGHADLLVHGPLTATLMLGAAETARGAPMAGVSLRALAPCHCGPLSIRGADVDRGLRVEAWQAGRCVMRADVTFA